MQWHAFVSATVPRWCRPSISSHVDHQARSARFGETDLEEARLLVDARRLEPEARLRAHVCVIGAGPAGITVALELGAAGIDVLLVEGGGRRATRRAQNTLRGIVEGDHDPLEATRQKRIGGTSGQWGGRCVPLDPLEFEARPWIPHTGWPIGVDQLDRFYRRAQDYCDAGAYDYTVGSAMTNPAPFLAPSAGDCAGDVASDVADDVRDDRIWRWGPPVDFGARYGRHLRSSPRIRLVHHADVVRLDQSEDGGRIVEAIAVAANGRQLHLEASEYVIAAGGLETARLLLASSSRMATGIGNSHDLVGRFYMTHPVGEVGRLRFTDPIRGAQAGYLFARDGTYCRRIVSLTTATQRREELRNLGIALWYPDPRDPRHHDGLLSSFALVRFGLAKSGLDWKSSGMHRRYLETEHLGDHVGNVVRDLPRTAGFAWSWIRHRWLARRRVPSFAVPARSGDFRLRFDAEQAPDPENRVMLADERDASSMPRLVVRHHVGVDDRASIVRSLHLLHDELTRTGVATLELPPDEEVYDVPFPDGTHQMGVARMADSLRDGVVDRDCRVHGVGNLSIASSAVFPVGGFEAPTLTTVALALRVAERLGTHRQVGEIPASRDATSAS